VGFLWRRLTGAEPFYRSHRRIQLTLVLRHGVSPRSPVDCDRRPPLPVLVVEVDQDGDLIMLNPKPVRRISLLVQSPHGFTVPRIFGHERRPPPPPRFRRHLICAGRPGEPAVLMSF
jgi:hypothetical protein